MDLEVSVLHADILCNILTNAAFGLLMIKKTRTLASFATKAQESVGDSGSQNTKNLQPNHNKCR